MSTAESATPQLPRFRWSGLLLHAVIYAALFVGVTAFSPTPPDPEYWGTSYVARIYQIQAIVGLALGAVIYCISFWMRRALNQGQGGERVQE